MVPLSMAKKSPSAIDRQIGARVRMRRLMLDISQEQLAEGLGISFQQVQKYERGINRIGAGRLQKIADVLQVPASFFFEDFAKPGKKAALPSHIPDLSGERRRACVVRSVHEHPRCAAAPLPCPSGRGHGALNGRAASARLGA
jgi:transcriptional regulator with XRE-family HTH domain